MAYKQWLSLNADELSRRDIVEVNLVCAKGLPHSDELDIPFYQNTINCWTVVVQQAIHNAKRYRRKYHQLTDTQFDAMVMVTVLQRDLGVTYNHQFSEGEYDATDSRNLFLHGLLSGHGGTCVTMPILYIAIGRRLGFPLKLVKAKEHLFCRYDGNERFNIEATARGYVSHPDEYYLKWPKPIAEHEYRLGGYLKSLSAKEEFAQFLAMRGNCWTDHLQTMQAVEAYYHAHQLAPDDPSHYNHWGMLCLMHRLMQVNEGAQLMAPQATS